MDNKKKPSYKERNGTTRVGDALRKIKGVAPTILDVAGSITGIDALNDLADLIKKDKNLTDFEKDMLLKELDLDIQEAQEVSKRWDSDMKSDSWLSKNVRPITMLFLLFCMFLFIILDSSMPGFAMNEEWIFLLKSLLITAVGGYFVVRSGEKIFKKK